MSKLAFGLLNGVAWGTVLALLSSGLNVVFGLMGTVNVAHGSLYMFGAYLAWICFSFLDSFWLSLIVSPLTVGLVGVSIGLLLKPVRKDSILTVLGTFGITLVLQGSALVLWGGTPRRVPLPFDSTFSLFGTGYSFYRIFVALVSGLVLYCLWFLVERTKFGLRLRASREDPELSSAIGIPVFNLFLLGFALGGALAGLSGAFIAPLVSLTPGMGLRIFAIVFLIVIIGGLGKIWRSVVVAIYFSVFRGLASVFLDSTKGLILTFSLALLVILINPRILGRSSANANGS
ncbi:MAG: branched-chain amino acid ABC transporter permease [Candidatus Bipolaricaulota bacterium]|nr:branched-chain amino acid ABC transporter permease [Candidatus Bipolaricaulota bacterium]